MTDSAAGASGSLNIPDEVRKRFPDLIALIFASQSMNDEERQYWVNILPIMTPEQIQNLRDILENERKQLAAIDKKYANQPRGPQSPERLAEMQEDRKKKKRERTSLEYNAEKKEDVQTEELLKKIEEL